MTNVYSLADYTLTVTLPYDLGLGFTQLTIGGPGETGEGSLTGNITVSYTQDRWSTEGDATGSYVHVLNLNHVGSVSVTIKQVSDKVLRLHQLLHAYESIQNMPNGGLLLTINSNSNSVDNTLYTVSDARIKRIPNQEFGENVADQTWDFTCGRILPNMAAFNI